MNEDGALFAGIGIGLMLGFMFGGFFFGTIEGTKGVTSALQATRPCTKDSPLMKQVVQGDTWVCVDGAWKGP